MTDLRGWAVVAAVVLCDCGFAGDGGGRDGGSGSDGGGSGDGGVSDGGGTTDGGGGTDGGGTDGGGDPCLGLSLHDCRLDARCLADVCDTCTCEMNYRGCFLTTAPRVSCPALGCMSPQCCSSDRVCGAPLICVPPGAVLGCSACNTNPGNCKIDVDCSTGEICRPIDCSCSGEGACAPGCGSNADCTLGEECDTSSAHPRCVPASCGATTPCPPDFDCTGRGCTRRSCTDDLVCDGFCVLFECFATLGACGAIPP